MKPQDRKILESLRISQEAIEKAETILNLWGIKELFTTCSHCRKPCYHPDIPRGRVHRKKLPAELFYKREVRSFRDADGTAICESCEEWDHHYG